MMIMCLSVLPSFAKAEEQKDLLSGVIGLGYSDSIPYPEFNDGKPDTFVNFRSNHKVTFNLRNNVSVVRSIKFKVDNPVNIKYLFIILYATTGKTKTIMGSDFNGSDTLDIVQDDDFKVNRMDITFSNNSSTNSFLKIYDMKVLNYIEELPNVSDLNFKEGVNDVSFTWKNPPDSRFTGLKIYNGDSEIVKLSKDDTFYKISGLEANKNYNFKFVSMYGSKDSGVIQKGVKTLIDPKTIPPSPVSSLTAEPTDKTVKLKWKSPKDDDLAGFKILQNGKQVAEIGLEEEFTVKNLQPLTDYTFGVISVDRDKNDSPPVSLSVKTLEENDEEPPHVPSNVFAKPSNGSLIASWDKVSDKDLAGYNVYVDGKKINSNLITSTTFVIKNLENSRKYKIQVQAVDRSGNASELSLAAFGTPDVNTIPVIESNYGLKDVSDGVGTMFSQIWPALAFSVGIVLAFYVIYKLKHTILP
jgi:chitodextrinase